MRFSLSIQQSISIAFLTLVLLVLIASGSGMLFTTAVVNTTTTARQGIDQFDRINGLRERWLALSQAVDHMLLVRDPRLVETGLDEQIQAFNQQLLAAQNLAAAGSNSGEAGNLLISGAEIQTQLADLLQAAQRGDWEQAQMLRDSQLAEQQQRLNDSLAKLNQSVQRDIEAAFSYSARAQRLTNAYWLFAALTALAVGVALTFLAERTITGPVQQLIAQVERAAAGDSTTVQPLSRKDELGQLSSAISTLLDRLSESTQKVEDRFARDSVALERRTRQLQAAVELARAAASMQNLEALLERAAGLVQSGFGCDQVEIYLLDAGSEAALRAAAGNAGRDAPAPGLRALVEAAAQSGQAQFTPNLNDGADPGADQGVNVNGSAAALPVKTGDRVTGVLAVQSDSGEALLEEDAAALQIMAELLSSAIQKKRLVDRVQEKADELERLQRCVSQDAWEGALQQLPISGYRYDPSGLTPISPQSSQREEDGSNSQNKPVCIPLESRGAAIGVLEIWPGEQGRTSGEKKRLLADRAAGHLSLALENALLFEQSQRAAAEAEVLYRASSQIHASKNYEQILDALRQHSFLGQEDSLTAIALFDRPWSEEHAPEWINILACYPPEPAEHLSTRFSYQSFPSARSYLKPDALVMIPDVENDPRLDEAAREILLSRFRARSAVFVPLVAGEEWIGTIQGIFRSPAELQDSQARRLMVLAGQAAAALQNIHLLDQANHQTGQMQTADLEKSQFLANISRELRAPLNSIIGFSRIILKGVDGPVTPFQFEDLTAIYNSGQHLLSLINDILDLSKLEAGNLELCLEEGVDLAELIDSVLATTNELLKDKPVELQRNIAPNLPRLRVDPARIQQVLFNILSIAARATEEGSITVDAGVQAGPDGRPEVAIAVLRTGPGVQTEDQADLSLPFSQSDSSTTWESAGSSLSLSLIRRLVELHGGRTGLEGDPGKGSKFYFTLPVFIPPQVPNPEA